MSKAIREFGRHASISLSLYVVGYLILMGAVAFGFNQLGTQADEIKAETAARTAFDNRRAYDICLASNENRENFTKALRTYNDRLVAIARANPNPNQTPEELARSERSIAQLEAETEELLKPLGPRDCGTPPPVVAVPTPIP